MLYMRYVLLVLFMSISYTQTESIFNLKGLQQSGFSLFNTLKRNKLAASLALSGAAAFLVARYRPHYFSTDYWKSWFNPVSQQTAIVQQVQQPVVGGSSVSQSRSSLLQSEIVDEPTQAPVVTSSSQDVVSGDVGQVQAPQVGNGSEHKTHVVKEKATRTRPVYQSAKQTAAKQKSVTPAETFEALVAKSDKFFGDRPITENNKIKRIAGNDLAKQETILKHAINVHPIMHRDVEGLINAFLDYKQRYGSSKEQELYKTMTPSQFIDRLLINRPLAFFGVRDDYLLKDRKTSGKGGFDDIGTDQEQPPLVLKDYLSYDEMAIAALFGVSVPTYFINYGDRLNRGRKGSEGTFQEEGVYVGLVGARFEVPGVMEYSHMLIDPNQNTPENGYGNPAQDNVNKKKSELLAIWSRFYDEPYFKTYNEVQHEVLQKEEQTRYIAIGNKYLDTHIYKKRLKFVLEPFFHNANQRGQEHGRQVYCHVVGLGIGVWAVRADIQEKIFFDACVEILSQNKFAYISDVDFSWFGQLANKYRLDSTLALRSVRSESINPGILLHISKRNPADRLKGDNENKLLVAMYAWDGNAYPGNEYWVGMLDASGDPAAACCSTITELQNPAINSYVSHEYMQLYP